MGAAVTGLSPSPSSSPAACCCGPTATTRTPTATSRPAASASSRSAYAITTPNLEVGAGAPGFLLKADRYGTIRLETMAKGGKPLFVGVARTRDVDAYLRGVAHSEVSDIDYAPFRARYDQRRRAPARPARPAQQRIWAARGEHALTWDVQSGDWSVVVMNADGSRGVAAAVSAGAKVPYIAEIAYVTLGFGLLFVIATTALTMYGTRPPSPRNARARR